MQIMECELSTQLAGCCIGTVCANIIFSQTSSECAFIGIEISFHLNHFPSHFDQKQSGGNQEQGKTGKRGNTERKKER